MVDFALEGGDCRQQKSAAPVVGRRSKELISCIASRSDDFVNNCWIWFLPIVFGMSETKSGKKLKIGRGVSSAHFSRDRFNLSLVPTD